MLTGLGPFPAQVHFLRRYPVEVVRLSVRDDASHRADAMLTGQSSSQPVTDSQVAYMYGKLLKFSR